MVKLLNNDAVRRRVDIMTIIRAFARHRAPTHCPHHLFDTISILLAFLRPLYPCQGYWPDGRKFQFG